MVKNNYIVSGMLKGASPQLSELVAGKAALFNEFTLGRNKVEYKRLVF